MKIKDCQVVQARMSREHGGNDHKTELQVGSLDETQLYKVIKTVLLPNIKYVVAITGSFLLNVPWFLVIAKMSSTCLAWY